MGSASWLSANTGPQINTVVSAATTAMILFMIKSPIYCLSRRIARANVLIIDEDSGQDGLQRSK